MKESEGRNIQKVLLGSCSREERPLENFKYR